MAGAQVLGERALNRAQLNRQLLLRRQGMTPLRAIEHLAGMQAQAPNAPYVGLWTRLPDFRPAQLADVLTERAVVRTHLMRNTGHLVSAADCLAPGSSPAAAACRCQRARTGPRRCGYSPSPRCAAGRPRRSPRKARGC